MSEPHERTNPTILLGEIADLLPYLPLMTTTHNPLDGEPRPQPPGSRPPLNLEPIVLADDVHDILGSWVRLAHEERLADDDDWPASYTLALCLWLQRHSAALCAHEAGAEYRSEILAICRRVRRSVGERTPRSPRCTSAHQGQVCHTPVVGINADGDETDIMEHWTWCRCPGCGMTYTFDAALRRLGQLQNLTVPQYAAETGTQERTLRRRVTEAHLTPTGRQGRHPTYARTDLDRVSRPATQPLVVVSAAGRR